MADAGECQGELISVRPVKRGRTGRTGYPLAYCEYSEKYSAGERTIKRWVKLGRKAGQPPPLDAPEEMAAWWGKVMRQRVPDRILALAAARPAPSVAPAPAPAGTPPPDPEGDAPPDVADLGLEASVRRLQRLEYDANQRLVRAIETNEDIEGAQRRWERVVELLRKAESSLIQVRQERGDMVPKAEVRAAIVEVHGQIATSLRGMLRRVWDRLAAAVEAGQREEIWQTSLDDIFESMRDAEAL